MNFGKVKAYTHTQTHVTDKRLPLTVFASYSRCQRGRGCYFKRTEPLQKKKLNSYDVVEERINVFPSLMACKHLQPNCLAQIIIIPAPTFDKRCVITGTGLSAVLAHT